MLGRVIISALVLSLHFVNSTVMEYQDQEEPHRELMIDQPQKVNRGKKTGYIYLKSIWKLEHCNMIIFLYTKRNIDGQLNYYSRNGTDTALALDLMVFCTTSWKGLPIRNTTNTTALALMGTCMTLQRKIHSLFKSLLGRIEGIEKYMIKTPMKVKCV